MTVFTLFSILITAGSEVHSVFTLGMSFDHSSIETAQQFVIIISEILLVWSVLLRLQRLNHRYETAQV
jgi:hypothetical protein